MKSIARNGVPMEELANPICSCDYKDPDIVAYGLDGYNQAIYENVTMPLQCKPDIDHAGGVMYENHPQDSRVTGPLDVAPTCSAKYGTGGEQHAHHSGGER